jgi:hypothetical protein
LDAAGSTVEGRFTDGQAAISIAPSASVENGYSAYGYPYEVKIYLWLNNEK